MQRIDGGKKIEVILTPELVERLDRMAARLGLKKAQAARNMMDVGLSVFEDFERVGIVRLAEIIGKTKKALRTEVGQQSLFKA